MAQKFIGLEDAAKQLGVSKDRLNDLREAGKVRAYRDGTSWKFRADDIEKLLSDGLPSIDWGDSDLSLDDAPAAKAEEAESAPPASSSELELDLGDDEQAASEAASDIDLDELDEPTVPAESAGEDEPVELAAEDADDNLSLSDSVLLSETELGESTDRPPSTIIGKAEMAADLDLELSSDSDAAAASDVKLAPHSSDVLSATAPAEQVLDTEPPSMSDNFSGMEELEVDLEAESSRILSPEDVAKAKRAPTPKPAETSDLELAASDSDAAAASSGGALDSGGEDTSGGLTGISALELEGDEDDVLGEGSDITLSGESSGINIISPSDSGLDLGDVSLDLTGSSPIGSSIDLGSIAGDEAELEPLEVAPEEAEAAKREEPFTLTPLGEEAAEEEEDSSQVIPLDEVAEEDAAGALLGAGAAESLGEDFAAAGIPTGAMAATEPVEETSFPGWVMGLLSVCLVGLTLCGMMTYDLVRNIWSWDQTYSINSTLLEVVNIFLR